MEKIINKRNVQVIVPNSELNDNTTPYYAGREILVNESLNDNEQYLAMYEDTKCNVSEITSIEPQFVQLILGESLAGKQGLAINMLTGEQVPYVYVDVAELDNEFKDGILLKDYVISYHIDNNDNTKVFVEIGHYIDSVRLEYTQFDEIKEFATKYGAENVRIIDMIVNDTEELI